MMSRQFGAKQHAEENAAKHQCEYDARQYQRAGGLSLETRWMQFDY
jgi:hypothetical protein